MSIFERALSAVETGTETVHEAVSEFLENRAAAQLFLKLGIAAYAENRLGGTHEPVEKILAALDAHAEKYGIVDLDDLKAAHEVLDKDFLAAHSVDD
ncbi:hypothetical protein [Streptacidiphilus monticola]|uniref:Uncharacterized protein n=1 Tax=Streptacidiphilus monticola TaxID=2161674 RepID=A0ABW1GBB2_9ACTN